MTISNRDRFPDVDFLDDDEIRLIGIIGGDRLALIGFEQGTDAPVVSRAQTDDPANENLFAVPLYELMSHSYDSIVIPDPVTR